MAKFVLTDASLVINSVDLSDHVASVTLELNSEETAWKNTLIWSEFTNSGKAVGIVETKFKKSLNNLGISRTNDCIWTYSKGINHVNIAAPIIINIENWATLK